MDKKFGKWAFLAGVIIALVLGIVGGIGANLGQTATNWLMLALVVLGLIVGSVNITTKEATPFLVAAVALLIADVAGLAHINTLIPHLGNILEEIIRVILVMIAPAALVVGIKAFYELASKK